MKGSDIPELTARAVVDAPPEKVWALVSDCGNYKETMPNIMDSKLVSSTPGSSEGDGEIRVCQIVTDLPFPLPDLMSKTRVVHTIEPGKRWQRAWTLLEGDYEKNEGMWRVEPFGGDGSRSLVTYVLSARPKIFLPAGMIASVSEGKIPEMMKNVRARTAGRP